MNKIAFWYHNARPTSLPQSVMPSLLAVCLAISADGFCWWLALPAVVGVAAAHLSLNMFDDYFDYRKTNTIERDRLAHEGFRARIGKCGYLSSGHATINQLLAACMVLLCVALAIGAFIFAFRGVDIVYIAGAAGLLGIFYSAPPLRLSYHGLGELTIGAIFGPLNMMGVYYAACGELNPSVVLISLPVGLWVMNIVYVHSILDFIPDKKAGKRTLAVLFNNTTAMLAVLFLILFLPYLLVGYGIATGRFSPFYAFILLTAPMAIALFRLMLAFVRDPNRRFAPRLWYGPMTNWKKITASKLEWFMIRWLLARNMLTLFCLIIMILGIGNRE